jgi:hypothetical protein
MKEISAIEFLNMYFQKNTDKETCSILELNTYKISYLKDNPYTIVNITRTDLYYINPYYYEYENTIYKQKSIKCPICGDIHYKYPETKKYKKIQRLLKIFKIYNKYK